MNRRATENPKPLKRLAARVVWCAALLLLPLQTVRPADAALQPQIDSAIQSYLQQLHGQRFSRVETDIQPLDNRLHLSACDQPPGLEHRPRDRLAGRLTFRISCTGTKPWTLHVAAQIKTLAPVVVAAENIPMTTPLNAQHLRLEEQDVSQLSRGYFSQIRDVAGFVAKRPIPAGQVLTPLTLNPVRLVNKGENVAILAEGGGITVRSYGTSLMDGALGELIQVRNTKSNKVVEGRIIAPGQIKVSL